MIDLRDLHVGDKVKIVDHWSPGCIQNCSGKMDHWLGAVMTVRNLNPLLMEEDRDEWCGGWYWNECMIDYIIGDESLVVDIADFL